MRCLKCVGRLEINDLGVIECIECKTEFLMLNGELRAIEVIERDKEVPILTSVDCCPRCRSKEIVGGEIIAEDGKNYRVYRCECGAEALELLVDQREYMKYCEETAEKLLTNGYYSS